MKKILFAALPIAAIAFMAFKSISEPLPIGAALPNAESKMKDISGKEISFKDATKKNGLLVMFSCNTCPVVKKYQGRTLEAAKLAASKEIGVILLNPNEATRKEGDSFDDMKTYAKAQGYDFSYVIDNNSAMADVFGATRTPEVFLFDKNNKLVYHGAIDSNPDGAADDATRKHLAIAIDQLASGKAIETSTTRSVGCGIKRVK
jgi:thioredoxin-related protein